MDYLTKISHISSSHKTTIEDTFPLPSVESIYRQTPDLEPPLSWQSYGNTVGVPQNGWPPYSSVLAQSHASDQPQVDHDLKDLPWSHFSQYYRVQEPSNTEVAYHCSPNLDAGPFCSSDLRTPAISSEISSGYAPSPNLLGFSHSVEEVAPFHHRKDEVLLNQNCLRVQHLTETQYLGFGPGIYPANPEDCLTPQGGPWSNLALGPSEALPQTSVPTVEKLSHVHSSLGKTSELQHVDVRQRVSDIEQQNRIAESKHTYMPNKQALEFRSNHQSSHEFVLQP